MICIYITCSVFRNLLKTVVSSCRPYICSSQQSDQAEFCKSPHCIKRWAATFPPRAEVAYFIIPFLAALYFSQLLSTLQLRVFLYSFFIVKDLILEASIKTGTNTFPSLQHCFLCFLELFMVNMIHFQSEMNLEEFV